MVSALAAGMKKLNKEEAESLTELGDLNWQKTTQRIGHLRYVSSASVSTKDNVVVIKIDQFPEMMKDGREPVKVNSAELCIEYDRINRIYKLSLWGGPEGNETHRFTTDLAIDEKTFKTLKKIGKGKIKKEKKCSVYFDSYKKTPIAILNKKGDAVLFEEVIKPVIPSQKDLYEIEIEPLLKSTRGILPAEAEKIKEAEIVEEIEIKKFDPKLNISREQAIDTLDTDNEKFKFVLYRYPWLKRGDEINIGELTKYIVYKRSKKKEPKEILRTLKKLGIDTEGKSLLDIKKYLKEEHNLDLISKKEKEPEIIPITKFDPKLNISREQAIGILRTKRKRFNYLLHRYPWLKEGNEISLGQLTKYVIESRRKVKGEEETLRILGEMGLDVEGKSLYDITKDLKKDFDLDLVGIETEEIIPSMGDKYLEKKVNVKEIEREFGIGEKKVRNAFYKKYLINLGSQTTTIKHLTEWIVGRGRVPEEENLSTLNTIYQTEFKTMEAMLNHLNTEYGFDLESGEKEKIPEGYLYEEFDTERTASIFRKKPSTVSYYFSKEIIGKTGRGKTSRCILTEYAVEIGDLDAIKNLYKEKFGAIEKINNLKKAVEFLNAEFEDFDLKIPEKLVPPKVRKEKSLKKVSKSRKKKLELPKEIIITEFDPNLDIGDGEAAYILGINEMAFSLLIERTPHLQKGKNKLKNLAKYAVETTSRRKTEEIRLETLGRMGLDVKDKSFFEVSKELADKYNLVFTPGIKPKIILEKKKVKETKKKTNYLDERFDYDKLPKILGETPQTIKYIKNTVREKPTRRILTKHAVEMKNIDALNRLYGKKFKSMEEVVNYLNSEFKEFNFEIDYLNEEFGYYQISGILGINHETVKEYAKKGQIERTRRGKTNRRNLTEFIVGRKKKTEKNLIALGKLYEEEKFKDMEEAINILNTKYGFNFEKKKPRKEIPKEKLERIIETHKEMKDDYLKEEVYPTQLEKLGIQNEEVTEIFEKYGKIRIGDLTEMLVDSGDLDALNRIYKTHFKNMQHMIQYLNAMYSEDFEFEIPEEDIKPEKPEHEKPKERKSKSSETKTYSDKSESGETFIQRVDNKSRITGDEYQYGLDYVKVIMKEMDEELYDLFEELGYTEEGVATRGDIIKFIVTLENDDLMIRKREELLDSFGVSGKYHEIAEERGIKPYKPKIE